MCPLCSASRAIIIKAAFLAPANYSGDSGSANFTITGDTLRPVLPTVVNSLRRDSAFWQSNTIRWGTSPRPSIILISRNIVSAAAWFGARPLSRPCAGISSLLSRALIFLVLFALGHSCHLRSSVRVRTGNTASSWLSNWSRRWRRS